MESTVDLLLGPFCSGAMRDIARTVEHIAASDLSILVVGESGTGKEWLARRIHLLSTHAMSPFIPVFCSMLTTEHIEKEIFGAATALASGAELFPGVFERAKGGTVFFDDIASLPPASQMKLAAVLEMQTVRRLGTEHDIPFDVRVISTLDRKAEILVAEGSLRKDLFYRISPIIIEMPPLRRRKEDIPLLIEKLLLESNERHGCRVPGMGAEAMRLCMAYDWPGNIRELHNALDYAVLMSRDAIIAPEYLPHYVSHSQPVGSTFSVQNDMNVASVEKLLIEQALNESRTKKQAAKRLGISLKTLYNKLSRYDLYDKFVNYTRGKNELQPPNSSTIVHPASAAMPTRLAEGTEPPASFPIIPTPSAKGKTV